MGVTAHKDVGAGMKQAHVGFWVQLNSAGRRYEHSHVSSARAVSIFPGLYKGVDAVIATEGFHAANIIGVLNLNDEKLL
jgi:hypothetical protein